MNNELQIMPPQGSGHAAQVDALYLFLVAISAFFTLLIFSVIFYFAIKYRRRSRGEVGQKVQTNTYMEVAWSVIPFFIVMVIFFWGARLYFMTYKKPQNPLSIQVIGKQWMWKVQHPTGQREINTLHIPVGRPVELTLASQDVIHSFYVPAFRVKQDAVPGRYTAVNFTPSAVGTYHLFCAEYCGTEHSRMIGQVIVMEPDAYEAWLSGTAVEATPENAGQRLYQQFGCATCHGSVAPTLSGLFGSQVKLQDGRTLVADDAYLRESILDATAKVTAGYAPIMPSYRGQINEEQLMQLIAYIKSLKEPAQRAAAPRPQ